MKINIHTDQYIAPAQGSVTNPATRPASSISGTSPLLSDQLTINSSLTAAAGSRAARVSQLAELYASGRYAVNSAQVAESLVQNGLS